ncbi:hypothetical protein NS365_03335 [Aureimonas ureilytica]|uniref:Uncharacterized protein n=1 Tax=Aureimonas ureilytica TaxID=401562 RepID=A0A175RXJ2_9HYPH|nr:hypothetical protein [Aureimonas ureilytica]KTQ80359.1 hypothetical protein NS226_22855 [Aureimonas ureilytica]KTR07612.1 hypothetical protein NS365_03335 [Aureimonas ureilytica]
MSPRLDDRPHVLGSAASTPKLGSQAKQGEARPRAPLAEGEPLERSPWHVSLFLRRFLLALAVGLPAIFLVSDSWGEAFLLSAVFVVALQAIYLVLAFLFI